MPRKREHDEEWEYYREELRTLFLRERKTVDDIKKCMEDKYQFCKSNNQFTYQFKKWNWKKNATEDQWTFTTHRVKKRKVEEGKDSNVYINEGFITEDKLKKETSRHVPASFEYLPGPGPETPDGVFICTPPAMIEHETAANVPSATTEEGNRDVQEHALFDTNIIDISGDHQTSEDILLLASPPELNTPFATCSFPELALISSQSVKEASSLIIDCVKSARSNLTGASHDIVSILEPITVEGSPLGSSFGPNGMFQSSPSEVIRRFFDFCVFMASNNMMEPYMTAKLVRWISNNGLRDYLKNMVQMKTITAEIFATNLLLGAVMVEDVETIGILLDAEVEVDTPGGICPTTALQSAVMAKNVSVVQMLLKAGADPNFALTGNTPLQEAVNIWSNPLEMVQVLLTGGADPNYTQNPAKARPLQSAVDNADTELVRLLLRAKANPNAYTTYKRGTALQIACQKSKTEIPELLIAVGADIDARSGYKHESTDTEDSDSELADSDSESGNSVDPWDNKAKNFSFKPSILIAAEFENWETVQILLEGGAAVNPRLTRYPEKAICEIVEEAYAEGEIPVFTPLQAAVRAGNITMTRMLLTAGAHVDIRPKKKYGHTALQIAVMVCNERLVQILLKKGADVNAAAGVYAGQTALQAAAAHEDTNILTLLIDEGADVNAPASPEEGQTALQSAVSAGNIEAVNILLQAGANTNATPSFDSRTALQRALRIQDNEARSEMVQRLLAAGAEIDEANEKKHAALHSAVEQGDYEMAKWLLQKGVSPNPGFSPGLAKLTPLQRAAGNDNQELVRLLLEYGADVNAPAYWSCGRTALQKAAGIQSIANVRLLLEHGGDIRGKPAVSNGTSVIEAAVSTQDVQMVQLLLQEDPAVIREDAKIRSRILQQDMNTRWNIDTTMINILLLAGADVNSAPSLKSPLQIAAAKGMFDLVQILLMAGADINHCWNREDLGPITALQAGVESKNIDIVQSLLDWGADVNVPANAKGGRTALQAAISTGSYEIMNLLVQRGADINAPPSPRRGRTALQEAATAGNLSMTRYLIQHGANVNAAAAPFGGLTALQGAAINGNIRIVIILLGLGADINGAPAIENGRTAIEGATENGRLDTLHLLLNSHPNTEDFEIKRKRAVKIAYTCGHFAISRFLILYRRI
ncbi:hypothetical protein MW887_002522 [Aspergillus wentii]|nr:hypothetical protein MW887_002522 [Aspergillus wentii]